MKKRIVEAIVVCALASTFLFGCGSSSSSAEASTEAATEEAAAEESTEEAAAEASTTEAE